MENQDLRRAVQTLRDGGYTCVLVKDTHCYTATQRGVKPLLQWLDAGLDVRGFSAADKVVGKAAAFLYVLLGVRALHAGVISTPAIGVLEDSGIAVTWDTRVDAIRNRTNTGFCPMERSVMEAQTPQQARACIVQAVARLSGGQ